MWGEVLSIQKSLQFEKGRLIFSYIDPSNKCEDTFILAGDSNSKRRNMSFHSFNLKGTILFLTLEEKAAVVEYSEPGFKNFQALQNSLKSYCPTLPSFLSIAFTMSVSIDIGVYQGLFILNLVSQLNLANVG